MKTKLKKSFVLGVVVLISVTIINPINVAFADDGSGLGYQMHLGRGFSKGAAYISLYSYTWLKRFKKADKVVVYYKYEKSKKYKKTKSIKIKTIEKHDVKIRDSKAKGITKYKFKLIYKNGKTRKSKPVPVLALKKKGTMKVKKENDGTIVSIKFFNTSKKYNVKIKNKANVIVKTNKYDEENRMYEECSKKAVLSNNNGSRFLNTVVIKKRKTAQIHFFIKDEKSIIRNVETIDLTSVAAKYNFNVYLQNPKGEAQFDFLEIINNKMNDKLRKFFD